MDLYKYEWDCLNCTSDKIDQALLVWFPLQEFYPCKVFKIESKINLDCFSFVFLSSLLDCNSAQTFFEYSNFAKSSDFVNISFLF